MFVPSHSKTSREKSHVTHGARLLVCALAGVAALMAGCGRDSSVSMTGGVDVPFMGGRTRAPQPSANTQSYLFLPTGVRASSILEVEVTCPGEVHPSNPFEFQIRAANLSTTTVLRSVTILQELPPYVTLSSTTPTARSVDRTPSVPGNVVYAYELGELAPGASQEISGRAVAPDSGMVSFRASAEYDVAMDWQAPVVEPRLSVTKQAPEEVLVCEPLEYTVVVKNDGTGVARRLKLSEQFPSGLTTDGTDTFEQSIGDLPPGEERTITFSAQAERGGVFESFVVLRGNGINVESNRVSTVVTAPKITLARSEVTEASGNGEMTYTITVTNEGNGTARQLNVEESIPAGADFRSATPAVDAVDSALRWVGLQLQPGQSLPIRVTLSPQAGGAVTLGTVRAMAHCVDEVVLTAGE